MMTRFLLTLTLLAQGPTLPFRASYATVASGPTVLLSENFTGTNGTSIDGRTPDCGGGGTCTGVTWSVISGTTAIQSNQAQSTGNVRAKLNWTPANGDYTVSVTYVTFTAAYVFVCTRFAYSAAASGYCAWNFGTSGWMLRRFTPDGNYAALWGGSQRGPAPTNGDVVSIQATGSGASVTIKVWINGTQLGADEVDSSADRITTAGTVGVTIAADPGVNVVWDSLKME